MRRFIKDNRGMTLIELLIAITILGLVAAPLLHGFLTSAQTEVKARKMGEVTSVAQNVMETVEGNGYEAITSASESNLKAMFGLDSPEDFDDKAEIGATADGRSVLKLTGLDTGNKEYNATVDIDPIGYSGINSYGLSVNLGMDIVFEVPKNPINETETLKARTIVMTVVRNGNKIDFDVKYHFGDKNAMIDVDSETYTIVDGKVPSVYLMYAPSYTKDDAPETDTIEIYNEGTEAPEYEVEFDLYIVKQKHAGFQSDMLEDKEELSKVHIKQYLMRSYEINDRNIGATIYSNVMDNLGSNDKLDVDQVSYSVYNDKSLDTNAKNDIKNIQVETKPSTRIYQVTVKIYDGVNTDFTGEPLSILTGSILK